MVAQYSTVVNIKEAGKMEKRLTYNIRECSEMLGVSLSVCYQAARTGAIPTIRLGQRRLVVPRHAFHRMLKEGALPASLTDQTNEKG